MLLPSEILQLILSHGLDSCQTASSWAQVSPFFHEIVVSLLGVVVLEDGVRGLQDIGVPFDYKRLMGKFNTLYMSNEDYNAYQLEEFVKRYMHLLIVIESNRDFIDKLCWTVNNMFQYCNTGTNICVIYCNVQNPELHCHGMLRQQQRLIFSELHIVGKLPQDNNRSFDIKTLFERTYLYHMRNIDSLDVLNKDRKLISLDLRAINHLNICSFDGKWDSYFAECPNLRKIEFISFPTRTNDESITLPKCESIYLVHDADGSYRKPINGSQVSGELTLEPTFRSFTRDLKFYNLHFPNLRRLNLGLHGNHYMVRFYRCHFDSLESIDCRSSLVSWDDLVNSRARVKHIILSLDFHQIQWLCECPFQLERISINCVCSQVLSISGVPCLPLEHIGCQRLDLEINSMWHCRLYHMYVQPNLKNISDLRIAIKGSSLLDSIHDDHLSIDEYGIDLRDDCMILRVPSISHLSLSLLDEADFPMEVRQASASSSIGMNCPEDSDYSNIFFDIGKCTNHYTVSSSSNARSSTSANFDSITSNRQNDISHSEEDSTDSDSVKNSFVKTCKFIPVGICPETIIVNIPTLDASLISWEEVESNRISLLQVLIDAPESEVYGLSDLIEPLSEQIIQVLNYPYFVPLQGMIIGRFQVAVNFEAFASDIQLDRNNDFPTNLQKCLSLKGHNVRVFTEPDEQDCHVSVLLSRFDCFSHFNF